MIRKHYFGRMTKLFFLTGVILYWIPVAKSMTKSTSTDLIVEAEKCPGFSESELKRLILLEIGEVLAVQSPGNPLGVIFECADRKMKLTIRDSFTDKEITRVIAEPPKHLPGRERVSALAASQLFLASWAELFTPGFPEESLPADVSAETIRSAKQFVEQRIRLPRKEPTESFSLSVDGTVSVVDLRNPFPMYGARITIGFFLHQRWRIFASILFSGGRAERDAGRVDVVSGGAAVGAALDWLRAGRFSMNSSIHIAGHYLSLSGMPASELYTGSSFARITGETFISTGPRIRLGRFNLGMDAEAGILFPWISGLVSGEPAVKPYGSVFRGVLVFETLF